MARLFIAYTFSKKVHQILGEGHPIVNDHVAFRTFDISPVGLEVLAQHFLDLGYKEGGDYHFEAKNCVQNILSMKTLNCQKYLSAN